MANFTLELQGDREVVAKFVALPQKLRQALLAKIQELAINLRDKVQSEHLSGPTGEHTLNVITGNLRASLQADWSDNGSEITGRVFYSGDVPYAAIHEFGGIIDMPTKDMVRKLTGKDHVRKAYRIVMPERAPLRTGFDEFQPDIVEGLKEAVDGAINE